MLVISVTCPYHPTPKEKAVEMLRAAELREGQVLYDLGCGEGNILFAAAEDFGARCIGIEIDSTLADKAKAEAEKRGLKDKVTIICDDIFSPKYWAHLGKADKNPYAIRNADVVAIYLNFNVHDALGPYLKKELRKGAKVVSYEFYMRGWKEIMEIPMIFVFEKGRSF